METSLIFEGESGGDTKRGNYITNARPVRAWLHACVCGVGGVRCGYDDDGNIFVWTETAEAERKRENEVIESGC